jgi:hypothetical protein
MDLCHHHICATTKLFENLLPNLEFNSNEVELVTELNNWLPLIKLIAVCRRTAWRKLISCNVTVCLTTVCDCH